MHFNTNLLPIFSGTYYTIWDIVEYDDNGDEVEVDYDFKDLMRGIASEYAGYNDYIVKELNLPYITKIKFDGGFYSPREYNFSTDCLDFDMTINYRELVKAVKGLKDDQEFKTYLHDHFTSYDGFISFTPNNYDDILSEILTKGNEFDQSISAITTYLVGEKCLQDIEYEVHDSWQGNGYGGTDYTYPTDTV